MPELILTEEQTRVVKNSRGRVRLLRADGSEFGVLDLVETVVARAWVQGTNLPGWLTSSPDGLRYLQSLQAEGERRGGMSFDEAVEYVWKMRTTTA